jgi:predicted kinase
MKPKVYIFRGAPAVGKGTVIPGFCKMLPKPVAFISQDVLRWDFHLIGRSVADVTDEEHVFANQNTELLVEQYLKNGKYTVVVEGLYTWDDEASSQGSAKKLLELARKYGYDATSVVLRADKDELLRRNQARPYSVPLDEFTMLYDNIYANIDPEEVVIDSTSQTPEETLESLNLIMQKKS